ncbi:MAG: pantothenate kinase [Cyanobacteria bacterium QS_8_48_54]|jgi:type III pantothenate kinase|nr:MAG: pantothenate kinase [Cyanobacteria bacterium QS_9_48_30]PSP35376.1 MAG: pantothenate kinase [Cyanobacteria bacterium QS_8_48_54]
MTHGVEPNWLGLMIGNSRLHWAWFVGEVLRQSWDTNHRTTPVKEEELPEKPPIPLYIASVVPAQAALWQTYPKASMITLAQLPLRGTYSTLGIDRALGLCGAGETWGFPMLVIDAGTALTLTGANGDRTFVGGAILPGLRLQQQSLSKGTAALPAVDLSGQKPWRWALQTSEAINSGILYTILASLRDFITDWWQKFPDSQVAITGGDAALLHTYLRAQFPEIAGRVIADPHLIFKGIRLAVLG